MSRMNKTLTEHKRINKILTKVERVKMLNKNKFNIISLISVFLSFRTIIKFETKCNNNNNYNNKALK